MLKIRYWVRDFNPFKIQAKVPQLLVQLYNLPFEYSYPMVIIKMAKALGTPLKMDSNTALGLFVTFAMVLVKTNMMFGAMVLVKTNIIRRNNSFSVEFKYENAPLFYTTCHQIGCKLSAFWHRGSTKQRQRSHMKILELCRNCEDFEGA